MADLDEMTDLHAAAFAGEIGPLAGKKYLKALLTEAVSLVAEHEGRIVGYIIGAPDGYAPKLTRTLMPVIALGVLRNFPRVVMHSSFRRQVRSRLTNLILRREPSSAIFDATPAGCFNLVGIGTATSARGKGVGKALVRRFCEHARGRTVILDVFKDNAAARVLYEKCGFRDLIAEDRVIRMALRP
jgi:ribosomal protein S18 acetylase RimI-like enzyme